MASRGQAARAGRQPVAAAVSGTAASSISAEATLQMIRDGM